MKQMGTESIAQRKKPLHANEYAQLISFLYLLLVIGVCLASLKVARQIQKQPM